MKETETIQVYIKTRQGRTVCICAAAERGCPDRSCQRDTVTRDRFDGWRSTMRRDRYGK